MGSDTNNIKETHFNKRNNRSNNIEANYLDKNKVLNLTNLDMTDSIRQCIAIDLTEESQLEKESTFQQETDKIEKQNTD